MPSRSAWWSLEVGPGESPAEVLRRELQSWGRAVLVTWVGDHGQYQYVQAGRVWGGAAWRQETPEGPRVCWTTARLHARPVWLPETRFAVRAGLSAKTLRTWALAGCPHRLDGRTRSYEPHAVLAWLEERERARPSSRGQGSLLRLHEAFAR